MNLQFFRKHRKIFFVLMILAVFAMVTFGALGQLGEAIERFGGSPESREVVLNIYGQDISRERYLNAQNVAATMGVFGEAAKDADEATQALLILLVEAEQAGVTVPQQTAANEFNRLSAEEQQQLVGRMQTREAAVEAIGTIMTLQQYISLAGSAAKVLPEDVDDIFRSMYQSANITQVTIESEKLLDQVDKPTEEALEAHFQRCRDVLPQESPEGIGYKIPPRVSAEWIYMNVDEVAAKIEVTDEEVLQYYEQNKFRYVRQDEAEDGDDAAGEPDASQDEPADGTDAPPADAEPQNETAPQPEAAPPAEVAPEAAPEEEPARTLNAPEDETTESDAETAVTNDDQPAAAEGDTGDAATAQESAPADAGSDNPPVIQSENLDQGIPADSPAATEPQQPEVEYIPLDEIRDKVTQDLKKSKAQAQMMEKMRTAQMRLEQTPAMSLMGVAGDPQGEDDEPLLHIGRTENPVSQEEAAELPGIGEAAFMTERGPINFPGIALSVRPLGEGIFPNRPYGPMLDQEGNMYIFRITNVVPARPADSLDAVREQAVADLKLIEAQDLAVKKAEELVKQAKQSDASLADLAREAGYEVQTRTVQGIMAGEGSLERKALDAFDRDEDKFGTHQTADYKAAIAFEVTGGNHVKSAIYNSQRENMTRQALRLARQQLEMEVLGIVGGGYGSQPSLDLEKLKQRSNLIYKGQFAERQPQVVPADE